jgi:hypothetical protein
MKIREPKAMTVHCGDLQQKFDFGSKWSRDKLHTQLEELKRRIDFLPGLVFRDERGLLWKPKLEVWFEQVINKPEEKHG